MIVVVLLQKIKNWQNIKLDYFLDVFSNLFYVAKIIKLSGKLMLHRQFLFYFDINDQIEYRCYGNLILLKNVFLVFFESHIENIS